MVCTSCLVGEFQGVCDYLVIILYTISFTFSIRKIHELVYIFDNIFVHYFVYTAIDFHFEIKYNDIKECEYNLMTVNSIIKEILKKKKMTQTDLANQLGTTRQNLNNKMARDNFTIKELSEIARVLESEIIFRDDNGVNHIISYVPDVKNSSKNDEKSDFS